MDPMAPPNPERRSESSRQAILGAAFELCRERGYAKLTIEAIAARAGVGKQTIYRWWSSKGAVVLDALHDLVGAATDFPDTGDIIADLREQMNNVAELLSSPDLVPVYTGVIGAAQSDPALSKALNDTFLTPRIDAGRARLLSAQRQGQIRADADLDVVIEILYGPLYHRLLLRADTPSTDQVTTILDLAFNGLRPIEEGVRSA